MSDKVLWTITKFKRKIIMFLLHKWAMASIANA